MVVVVADTVAEPDRGRGLILMEGETDIEVVLVDDQVRAALLPLSMEVGKTEAVIVGGG